MEKDENWEVGSGKPEQKIGLPKPPVPQIPSVPPRPVIRPSSPIGAPNGIPMVGSKEVVGNKYQVTSAKPEPPKTTGVAQPVTPFAPRVIKPETDANPKSQTPNSKDNFSSQSKPPLRDINITMNMGAPGSQPQKEEPAIVSRVETPIVSRSEPLVVSRVEPQPAKRGDEAKDQNININISVTPPAQGIPMVGKVVESKAEPVIAIPEVPQFKPKTAMSDQPPIPANKIEDDVVDLRTFEIKKGSTNN